jgi:hypothetical protein
VQKDMYAYLSKFLAMSGQQAAERSLARGSLCCYRDLFLYAVGCRKLNSPDRRKKQETISGRLFINKGSAPILERRT